MRPNAHASVLSCVVALVFVTTAHAGDALDKGDAAFRRGDFSVAANWYARAVQAESSAWAEYNLGVMYSKGLGVKQDMAIAAKWLQIAATHPEMHDRATALMSTFAPQQTSEGVAGLVPPGMAQPSAPPGPLDDALAADKRGDYATELKLLEPLAEQGNAYAQDGLGFMYANGRGVPQDWALAVVWLRKAADQDFADAQTELGFIYENGIGLSQDYAQAAVWYRKAAEHGNATAQFNLGAAYANGQGLAQDYGQALLWWHKAADQGNAVAEDKLGWAYDTGQGVHVDNAEAAFWYRKAADQGNADAQAHLAWAYANGIGMPQDYAEAAVWYRKAADQGNAPAQNNLGWAYANGQGLPQDYAQAAEWYGKAAGKGNSDAEASLGWMYANGQGVSQDYGQAAEFYRYAANQGNAPAQNNLGWAYAHGQGVPQDYAQAAVWYLMAAEQGNAEAQSSLGLLYFQGQGVPRDYDQAAVWLRKAADQGNSDAKTALAALDEQRSAIAQAAADAAKAASDAKAAADSQEAAAKARARAAADAQKAADAAQAKAAADAAAKAAAAAQAAADAKTARLSQNEIGALIGQIKKCWTLEPDEIKSGLSVRLMVNLNRDGSVNGVPQVVDGNSTPMGRLMTREAQRAVKECSPYHLPSEKYQQWSQLDITLMTADEDPTAVASASPSMLAAQNVTEVALEDDGGTFLVPVLVNDAITLKFTLDSGAADVTIPADVVSTLMRTGTITPQDFTGTQTYTLADGSTVPSPTFRIHSLKVGDVVLSDIAGSAGSGNGLLLLGQTFLRHFKSWSIDNSRHVLLLTPN